RGGWPIDRLRTWSLAGRVFVAGDAVTAPDDAPLAAALVVAVDAGRTVELRAFAVTADAPAEGADDALGGVVDALRAGDVRRIVVAVRAGSADELGRLQRMGFRPSDAARGRGRAGSAARWLHLDL